MSWRTWAVDAQIPEERVGHGRVVVLAGVDQNRLETLPSAQLPQQGRYFHEVRASARHRQHPHRVAA
jgi:hypothetical protein